MCNIGIALIFNAMDLLTGLIAALRKKDIKSQKLRNGVFKKVGFLMCYALAWLIDRFGCAIGFNIGVDILPVIVGYVCLTEVVSIIENISHINPDLLPDKLMQLFNINEGGGRDAGH